MVSALMADGSPVISARLGEPVSLVWQVCEHRPENGVHQCQELCSLKLQRDQRTESKILKSIQ
jgi:hypothetical protein